MGGAVSSNVISMIAKTVANVSSDIIQKTRLSQDTSQIISVSDVDGDVTIKGNVFYQRATINMVALMTALASESSQQALMLQLSQEAKSLVSGLNIGQFADSSNTMDLLVEATINLLTTITQTCAALSSEYQEITIKRVKGNVYIQDNVFSQVSDIISYCTQNAVSNSTALQDITAKLDQTASATAEGLSAWAFVVLAALLLGAPVVGGIAGGYVFLKFIFPLVCIAGVVLLGTYWYWTTPDTKLVGFSTFISKNPICLGRSTASTTEYPNVEEANAACFKDTNCAAFDWQGIVVNEDKSGFSDGTYVPKIPPTTVFYNSVDGACLKSIKTDKVSTIAFPAFHSGSIDPDQSMKTPEGDAYLNTKTSAWFQKINGAWQYQDVLIKTPFARLMLDFVPPPATAQGQDGDYYLYFNPHNPLYLYLYRYNFSKKIWEQSAKLKGPGLIPSSPKITNASGFRVLNRKAGLLYLGIGALIIGVAGTAFVFLRKDQSTAKK